AHGGKAAPVDPHAASARPGAGRAAHRRVHRVCARKGLSQAGAVDAKPPGRGAAHLRVARIPAHESRTQRRFRQKAHQRNLGAEAIAPALIAAAVSSVLVGAGIAVSRLAVGEVPPLTLAMLRYAIGGACLLPFAWHEARAFSSVAPLHGRLRDLAGMAAIGILQFGVLIALLNYALVHTGAAEVALIFS